MSAKIVEIGKNIVLREDEHNTNMICVELEEGLVFIDSGRADELAKEFRGEMEKKFNKKTSHLLLTHYHQDHFGGMAAFKDVEIVASKAGYEKFVSDLSGRLTKERREAFVERIKRIAKERNLPDSPARDLLYKYYAKVELLPPTQAVEKKQVFGNDKKKIIFKVVGGHTECSAIVYIPFAKTLIIGDNLTSAPSNLGGCFFAGLSEEIVTIFSKLGELEIETVIPGHGPIADKKYLESVGSYFKELFSVFNKLAKKGISPEKIASIESIPKYIDETPKQWDLVMKRLYMKVAEKEAAKQIEAGKNKLIEAEQMEDLQQMVEQYTEKLAMLFPNGMIVEGKNHYKSALTPSINGESRVETIQKYFLGDRYIERTNWTYKDKTQENKKVKRDILSIWKQEENSWKIDTEIILSEEVLE